MKHFLPSLAILAALAVGCATPERIGFNIDEDGRFFRIQNTTGIALHKVEIAGWLVMREERYEFGPIKIGTFEPGEWWQPQSKVWWSIEQIEIYGTSKELSFFANWEGKRTFLNFPVASPQPR